MNFHPWMIFIIMLSTLTQAFSTSANTKEKNKLYPRQINLSGNIFHFSMPEDFSKDMPATNMVETLDISDPKKFDNPEYGNLIRRWWDIKEPGWFGKKLGTVMMDISVQRVAENKKHFIHKQPYDVKKRIDFMLMLDDSFHQRYDTLNAQTKPEDGREVAYRSSFITLAGRKIESNYREFTYNDQKWIENRIVAPRNNLIFILALPVTEKIYIEAAFTYSKNENVSLRDFLDVASNKMDSIQKTFQLNYNNENPFAKIVSDDWMVNTNHETLEQHRDTILKLFYGPNPEAALLKMERQNRESQARDEREMREILKHDPL